MKYICKNCGHIDHNKKMIDVLGYGKLCKNCLDRSKYKKMIKHFSKKKGKKR